MKQGLFQMITKGALIPFIVLLWVPIAQADTLETTDVQVTDTVDYETCPTLGQDATGEMVVFTSFAATASGIGPGEIMVQRLHADGTTSGPVVTVSDGTTDDQLNDVSGSRIVFTAYDPNTPMWGQVKLYDLDTGDTVDIMTEADTVREARIEGDIVVWTQGQNGDTRVNYFDLNWPTGIDPLTIGGPVPASYNVDIGSRYVVWEEANGASADVGGYDIYGGDYISIAADPDVDEAHPATFGQLIVWQATHTDGTTTIEIADMSVKPAARYTAVDNGTLVFAPSIHGNVVAYEGKRNASADLDIYLHRISDMADFPLTSAAGDQYLNNVFGDKVGYVDASAGQTDIHVATFNFVSSQPPGACDNAGGDADGDGVCQNDDNCVGVANPDQTDTDRDGVGNVCDNCPHDANPFQADADKDTLGDACDACPDDAGPDPDRDAVCTSADNCPFVANQDQNDTDGDGMGDACDPCPLGSDTDGDGDVDGSDLAMFADGQFDQNDLAAFAAEFGRTDCAFPDVDYWVSASQGSDSNPGTRVEPFKTISHALSTAGENKFIKVLPGTYDEGLEEIFPLVLQTGQVLIGDEANKGDSSTPTAILGYGEFTAGSFDYATIVGAESSRVSGFKIGEGPNFHFAIFVDGVTMQISHNTFKASTYGGVLLGNNGNSSVEDNVFDTSWYGVYIYSSQDGVVIQNNAFLSMAIPIQVGASSSTRISGNTITGNGQVGIQISGDPLIENNTFNRSEGYTYGALRCLGSPIVRGNHFICTTAITIDLHHHPDLGTASESGNNDFSSASGVSVTHDGTATVYAIGNTWPNTPPEEGIDIVVNGTGSVVWGTGPDDHYP
jgi:parallel beta-helix repeat protein